MNDESHKSRYGSLWNREESILAFDLYCRIPFQKTKSNQPEVKELARLLGRTPASIARKLGNFGAFDPALHRLNISGLTHTSKLDQEIWNEFHADWNELVWEASLLRQNITPSSCLDLISRPEGPSETTKLTKQRIHQAFFRDAVLSSYDSTCCVTGLAISNCLIASHIVPWSKDEQFRTDPTNGLCLSATFDRLFDAGLMTITCDFVVQLSSSVIKSKHTQTQQLLNPYHNQPIRRPLRFYPSQERLEWHRMHCFKP